MLSFGKRGYTGGEVIILGDNPAEHFPMKGFNFNKLFQIIHDCKCVTGKHFGIIWV